jgi:hypothetical protein
MAADDLIMKDKTNKKDKLTKETINIMRTTQRNNVELTHIADNKANVLLSLNAIMLTFLIPTVVANIDYIVARHLYIPLIILAVTCFATIYLSTIILKPARFDNLRDEVNPNSKHSPFFFGNYYKMEPEEFFEYMEQELIKTDDITHHLAQDLYFVGRRLGYKMTWIRRTFNIFLSGIFLSILTTVLAFFIG